MFFAVLLQGNIYIPNTAPCIRSLELNFHGAAQKMELFVKGELRFAGFKQDKACCSCESNDKQENGPHKFAAQVFSG
jgi:hypothetical protein